MRATAARAAAGELSYLAATQSIKPRGLGDDVGGPGPWSPQPPRTDRSDTATSRHSAGSKSVCPAITFGEMRINPSGLLRPLRQRQSLLAASFTQCSRCRTLRTLPQMQRIGIEREFRLAEPNLTA
jgi:hypothetical protein